ncbi:autotransporter outer membrane beta-barrel domain-containing protein [Xenorhabdus szentirmaii]|uniref:autotransporter outer membrane beta-barrel domain-containing protein n=1 Tax=Xenorhabdus szentirmaii TaxID=290112 RepID=UPI0019CD1D24|nr:autotransporter domain-containing protein [Xenorhabdus sp. 38]MBD2781837.1 autotransporter domain-containing protein [Xenorhabdus sp. 38]
MKKAFLFTPALLALSINAISTANAVDYKNIYVFGDSLSDGGNKGRYTDGQKQLYHEYFAEHILGIKLIRYSDSKLGGTNYARGGSTAHIIKGYNPDGYNPETDTSAQQLKNYLSAHNNRADSNGIYFHWIGGNDLAAASIAGAQIADPKEGRELSFKMVKASANAAGDQINLLAKAGAGLIVVPNVPNVSTTPRFLETLLGTAINQEAKEPIKEAVWNAQGIKDIEAFNKLSKEQKEAINNEINNQINKKIDEALNDVHKGINVQLTQNGEIRHLVIEGVLRQFANGAAIEKDESGKTKTAEDGTPIIDKTKSDAIYDKLYAAYQVQENNATELTNELNKLVDVKISEGHGNVLRADVNGLLNEVIANPLIYGIDNTLGYACPYGVSSADCSENDTGFTKDKKFLFADPFHPTSWGHQIIGQYIDSIYNAPLQVMTLNQANRAPVQSARASLDGHMQQLRNSDNQQGKVGIFGGYSGSQNKTFTLGGDYHVMDNLVFGAMYSNYKDERSPTADFTYEGRGHVFTAYALWTDYFNGGWLSGDIHHSNTNYDSLIRDIHLGQATLQEVGSTTGKQYGTRITAGWDIPVTKYLTTGPTIQYAWDKGEVDGYHESGNNYTSMRFSDQRYTSKVGTLGWRVDTQLGRFNPYASISFNHQFDNERYKMHSAIKSAPTDFVLEGKKQVKDWRQYTVGMNAIMNDKLRGFASVTRNDGNDQDANYTFSLGINATF